MNEIYEIINSNLFHAIIFTYKGKEFVFSGWWMLDWGDGIKEYESKEDFLNDSFFDGKTIAEISDDVTILDYTLET